MALEQLFLHHFSALERHIAPKIPLPVRRQLAAEDVLQDVFAQAYRDIGQFNPQARGTFLGWLKAIADHRVADALKHIRRKKRGGGLHQMTPPDPGRSSAVHQVIDFVYHDSGFPSKAATANEMAHAINVAVATLPEDQGHVVRARFFHGMKVKEIADRTGRTQGAVRGLIYRAKENLRASMGRSSRWMSSR
jgi:RNA polymerase sigma-70 factor (ECF subfamily)